MDEQQVAEFWSHVDRKSPDDCWEWTGTRWQNGNYGRLGRNLKAHRVSYELSKGPIPKGLLVRHECDNPPCCNPWHLVLGTNGENMKDKRERGRAAQLWGESHGNAVLSDLECDDIRTRFDAGESCASIHRTSYPGSSYGNVWAIARRITRANGSGVTRRRESGVFLGRGPKKISGPRRNSWSGRQRNRLEQHG